MKSNDIREYAEIMKDWGLQRLTVTENGATVCLEKDVAAAPASAPATPVFQKAAAEPEPAGHHIICLGNRVSETCLDAVPH